MNIQPERTEYDHHFALALIAMARADWIGAQEELSLAADSLYKFSAQQNSFEQNVTKGWLYDIIRELKRIELHNNNQAARAKMEARMQKKNGGADGGIQACTPMWKFDDIAGLSDVKEEVNYNVVLPVKYPDLYKLFRKKTNGGILMYGLPGTGKTMIAEAIAGEIGAKFFPVRCSDLGSKWFGETEQNIKKLFEAARKADKSVIFFDEVEAYASNRSDGETMVRATNELLSQLQGACTEQINKNILVIAATNKPWALDGAFWRPGRFDEKIYVPLPDKAARKRIMELSFAEVPSEDIDLGEYAERCEGFNGADVKYLCEKAKEAAIKRVLADQDSARKLLRNDLEQAMRIVGSSVIVQDKTQMQNWCARLGA